MGDPQSRTDLLEAMLKYAKNIELNERYKIKLVDNVITIVK